MCVALVLAFSQRCYEVRDCTDCGPCLCLSWFCNLVECVNRPNQVAEDETLHFTLVTAT